MYVSYLDKLVDYQRSKLGEAVSSKWFSLCASLRDYQAPCRSLMMNKERKWELVSAFQKSVRRGDKQMALRLISAMDNMPEDYGYLWRRLCIIACEDVGPADDTLVAFVIACSAVFTPKRTGSKNYDLFCFLAEQMCDLATRSRIYCSYAVVESAAARFALPELSIDDGRIIAAIMQRKAEVRQPENAWQEWQRKNDWRTDGLLKFVGLTLSLEMTKMQISVPPHKLLMDLPSYCYDMYTRVGQAMLKRIVRGVKGAEGIKELFQQNKVKSPHTVLGEALFFVEGGCIRGELIYEPLCCLEQRLFAYQFGLSLNSWLQLRVLVEKALEDGVIDRVREDVLDERWGSLFALDCRNEEPQV
jgi:hypothetical protein